MEHTNNLGTERIGKLLRTYALPGIAALVINALYNIVDQIFIGQGVGYLGNGATNVIFPLTTLAIAFALLIGDGAASYMSLMLGKQEHQKAAQGTAAGLIATVIAGVVIAAVYLALLPQLCTLFGATETIMPYAKAYGRIIALGLPFCTVCTGYASIIRADGSPKYNMAGLLTGCAINIVLDPIFIFICHWGVSGAAFATILGQIANAVINIAYIPRFKSVKITKADIRASFKTLPQVFNLGVSSFISQMVLVIVMAVQNSLLRTWGALSEYGADVPISALGVTMKVFSILMVIVIGLASGAQPIWGYNYGARQYKRVQQTFNLVIVLSFVVMTIAFVLFQLCPMAIISIFGSEDAVYNKFAIKTLRIFLLLVPVAGFQLVAGIFFQAVGKPVQASLISLSKQIVFMIPAMLILAPRMGVEGVLWSGPVSDALAFVLTVLLLAFSWKSIFGAQGIHGDGASAAFEPAAGTDFSCDEKAERGPCSKPSPCKSAEKPLVITIGRSYGAGGRAIGKRLAEKLGIPYYDRDLIKQAAAESGLSAEYLESVDETVQNESGSLLRNMATSRVGGNASADLRKTAEHALAAAMENIAEKGSCVIVGRRADQILKNKAFVFSVFVSMPLEARIKAVSEREQLSLAEAEKLVKRVDKKRAEFYNFAGSGTWGTAENYDLCLNLAKFSEEEAVRLIIGTLGL